MSSRPWPYPPSPRRRRPQGPSSTHRASTLASTPARWRGSRRHPSSRSRSDSDSISAERWRASPSPTVMPSRRSTSSGLVSTDDRRNRNPAPVAFHTRAPLRLGLGRLGRLPARDLRGEAPVGRLSTAAPGRREFDGTVILMPRRSSTDALTFSATLSDSHGGSRGLRFSEWPRRHVKYWVTYPGFGFRVFHPMPRGSTPAE